MSTPAPVLSERYTKTVDYAALIRQELFDVILRLKTSFHARHGVQPERVEVGDTRNSHRGYSILQRGDVVMGLPVSIVGGQDVRVVGDVEHEEEYWEADENDESETDGVWRTRCWTTYEMESDL